MKISEFVEKMCIRFDGKLQSTAQVDAFREDCKALLKPFEGEVLGFAFYELVAKRKFNTHPKIGEIREVCMSKQKGDHQKKNPVNMEAAKFRENDIKAKEFQKTDGFKWAADRLIGFDVLLHIQRTGINPTNDDVKKMLKSHDEFNANMKSMEDDIELSTMQLAIYKMGKALREKNKSYATNN